MSKDILQAFAADNFKVVREHTLTNGKKGYCAEHLTAKNVVNGQKKRAYYVEGSSYDMGYLTGYLAPDEVEMMGITFIDEVIFEFFKDNPDECFIVKFFKWLLKKIIQKYLSKWIYDFSIEIFKDIPFQYIQEIQGLADGYSAARKEAGLNPKVDFQDLWALNVGVDCLLSFIYAPDVFIDQLPKFLPKPKAGQFQIPVACNAFAVFGNAVTAGQNGGKPHYFGRDFMFPTAGVFQDAACHIIYNPDPQDGRLPVVSMSAPGFAGSIMAMNKDGVAMGVDMSPAGNCDYHRAGFNSLLLVRDSVHRGASAQLALDNIINAQRGVSWDYIIADGKNDRAVAVETGFSVPDPDFVSYPPDDLQERGLLPGEQFLKAYETQNPQNGLMVRWNDYQYPEVFLQFNEAIFNFYGKTYEPSRFEEHGYISRRIDGKIETNCPFSFYFAPQRENKDDVLIMTNHFIAPSMRLCGMEPWSVEVAKDQLDDIQWRYDQLNDLILNNYGSINWEQAWKLINYLAPDGCYVTDYYQHNPDYKYTNDQGQQCLTKQIQGSVSLCNLTEKVALSRYGYYADEPVTTTLLNYVD
jgi:hypothetical protein